MNVNGFIYVCSKEITYSDFIEFCNKLSAIFNTLYNSTEYKFGPEPITEGGILWINWPGKTDNQYKTMRLHGRNDSIEKWPWIKGDEHNTWKNNNTILMIKSTKANKYLNVGTTMQGHSSTFLKAFQGAPSWTLEELQLFSIVMGTIGITIKKCLHAKISQWSNYTLNLSIICKHIK